MNTSATRIVIASIYLVLTGTTHQPSIQKMLPTDNLGASFISTHDTLILTPGNVFFSPTGRLKNTTIPGAVDDIWNGNKQFGYTTGWTSLTDTLVWPLDITATGDINVTPYLAVPVNQDGAQIEVLLAGQQRDVTLQTTGADTNFANQSPVSFHIPASGRYTLQFFIKKKAGRATGNIANVKGIKLSGPIVAHTEAVRLRWRPAAVRSTFSSAANADDIEWIIGEQTVISRDRDSYSPITAPFGYFGSAWDAEMNKFTGINFSLWSKDLTDAGKLSHLLAVGKNLTIGGFNHEGTGVKPRGENPYSNATGINTQVLAIKKVPGIPFDIFYSYYLDMTTRKWQFYGCGKIYNTTAKLTGIKNGWFIEVPGPPDSQRSGELMREVHFRGWYVDRNSQIYPINKMTPSFNTADSISFRNWGVTPDNQFFMQMGGLHPISRVKPPDVVLEATGAMPDYLSKSSFADLSRLPAAAEMLDATNITSNQAIVRFNIKQMGTHPKVSLYWGKSDGLTFASDNLGSAGLVKWDASVSLPVKENGTINHTLSGLTPSTTYYYRLQIQNDQGELWTFNSGTFTTGK